MTHALKAEELHPQVLDNPTIIDRYGNPGGHKHFGQNFYDKKIKKDPRFPRPVRGGGRGSKELYSAAQIQAYFEQIAREGYPE